MAILHTDDVDTICNQVMTTAAQWQGEYAKELSISLGYAAAKNHKELDIHELEKRADREMYQAKAKYYKRKGIDRRHGESDNDSNR